MPKAKTKPAAKTKAKPVKKAAARAKSSTAVKKATKAAAPKKSAARKSSPEAAKSKRASELLPLDLSTLPPESVITLEKWMCLACVADVFTRHLGLAPRTAQLEIKRYTPQVAELYAPTVARPWFLKQPEQNSCPYCGAAAKWHSRLWVYRIESGKASDTQRRVLVKSLPQSGDQFTVVEEKSTQQHAFFEWLDKISKGLDLDNPVWLREISRHYLSHKEPKVDWEAEFGRIYALRRSRRLESGWEIDSGRLFLAPTLFDELLLVQYLVSRSHKAGGLTLEGRYTLPELFARLRNAGYLRAVGVQAQNPADALEQLVTYLSGGDSSMKFYHIIDRRDFLEKVKSLKLPLPKRKSR